MNAAEAAALKAALATVTAIEIDKLVVVPPPPPPPPITAMPQPTLYPYTHPSRTLHLEMQRLGRYERATHQATFTPTGYYDPHRKIVAKDLLFACLDLGGGRFAFAAPMYKLLADGVEVARVSPGAVKSAAFLPTWPITSKHTLLTIQPCNADGTVQAAPTEGNVPFAATINMDGKAHLLQTVYAQRDSHDAPFLHDATGAPMPHAIVELPLSWFTPTPQPLAPQVAVEFTTKLAGNNITRYMLAPGSDTGFMCPHHLCTSLDGVKHTNCQEGYDPDYYYDHAKSPNLDGERGVGTHYFYTFAIPGRGGKRYAHTPAGAFVRINGDSLRRKITLWGKRHKYAPNWLEARAGGPEEEYVGTCSDPVLKAAGPFISGGWGGDWDYRTLGLDPNAAPIGGDQPHMLDPTWFATDERGWITKITGDGQDPNRGNPDPKTWAPWDGKIFISGLKTPRGFAHRRGTNQCIVVDTAAHQIRLHSMDDGSFIRMVAENKNAAAFGYVPTIASRVFYRRWAPAVGMPSDGVAARAQPFIAPEGGVFYQDVDGDWLAFVSRGQMQVKRVHIDSGLIQTVGDLKYSPAADPGNQVTQLCVNQNQVDLEGHRSHGGFGPHGTIFAVTFRHDYNGRPECFAPNNPTNAADLLVSAKTNGYSPWNNWHSFTYGKLAGRGPGYSNSVYPTFVCVGYGELTEATCVDGIGVYRQATASDPVYTNAQIADFQEGQGYYCGKGYDLLGQYGNTPSGVRPWGENAKCDFWMTQHGWVK